MPTRRHTGSVPLGLACLLAACVPVTVNINFPQEKLEGAAGRIEDMVRSPESPTPPTPTPPPAERHPGYEGRRMDRLLAALGPRVAEAQSRKVDVVPEIRVRTPELMRAIESRRGRFNAIESWKSRGCIGENNQGFVEARPGQGCSGDVATLIAAENRDRRYTYQTLMRQNNIPDSDAPRVRAAFAKTNRDRAKRGEWVQQPNGRWVRK